MSYRQTIYNRLRKHGMTEAGALAMLGNYECESNCEPNRVQGDSFANRTISKSYTANYMNGVWGKDHFVNAKTGYGLAQWTYPTRQAGLWDFWKASGKALDDAEMQVDYSVKELKRDYPELWNLLCTSDDLYTLVKRVCYDFENPAVKNVDARYQAAERIRNELDLNGGGSGDDPDPQPEPEPKPIKPDKLVLRVVDKNCNGFPEVYLVQALLLNRGYGVAVDGIFPTDAVIAFQRHHGLEPDGVVGNMTYNALFER